MNVAILLWDEVELLSFAGPAQVFTEAGEGSAFFVYTVAESRYPITSQSFLEITPEFAFDEAPRPDVVIVPGGEVSYVIRRRALLHWVRGAASAARIILAVSSGEMILLASGARGSTDLEFGGNMNRRGETIVAPGPAAAAAAAERIVRQLYRCLARIDGAGCAGDEHAPAMEE